MATFNVAVIRDVTDYKKTLDRIKEIIHAEPGSKEYDELELASILVEEYEKRTIYIPAPDPISIIYFVMEQRRLRQIDLVGILGDKANVSKVLHRKRPLTLEMIRKFSKKFHIPADILVDEYELAF